MEPSSLGYAIEENVLSSGECDALLNGLSDVQRTRAGARHLMTNPAVAALAADPRLVGLASRTLGSQATPFRATLFEKSSQTNWLVPWHQDTALPLTTSFDAHGWGPWSEKDGIIYAHAPGWALSRVVALRVHLDASTIENGPLRVIPYSHTSGVLSDEGVLEHVKKHPQVFCCVPRGGVLAMCPLLIHSSSKTRNADPRRVLHLEYADSLDLCDGVRLSVA